MTDQVTENVAEQNVPKLTPNDILDAIKCIDHACEQGAYKGWRVIEQVLHVRSRLYNFIAAIQQTQADKGSDEAKAEGEVAPPEQGAAQTGGEG